MTDRLQASVSEGFARVTLARAPVNALTADYLGEISALFAGLAGRDDVKGVVLESAFKVFSAGLDLRETQGFGAAEQTAIVDALNRTFTDLYAFPKPLVAAVGGAAIAGGLFFPLTADLTVATRAATFGLAEVRVGVDFPVGPLEIARAELSPAGLRRLMLTGRPVDVTRAREIGIVDTVAEPGALIEAALAAVRDLAGAPPLAYAAVKAQIRAPTLDQLRRAIAEGSDPARDGWFTDETKAAMAAAIAR